VTGFLLDTSVVSAAMWRVPSGTILAHLREHGGECAIGAPVWHELLFGVRRMPRGRRRSALEAYLEEVVRPTLPILPYEDRSAEWHAAERSRLERLGRLPPFVDGQIAAIAVTNGLPLVTLNVADFETFKGLTVLDWTTAG
jgi:tRNA(fMet)-specific endonuclease VapC